MAHLARTAGVALVLALALPASLQTQGQKWVVPRTADGRPDLEGVWENNSATPLERPRQLADKPLLSDEELERIRPELDSYFAEAEQLRELDLANVLSARLLRADEGGRG